MVRKQPETLILDLCILKSRSARMRAASASCGHVINRAVRLAGCSAYLIQFAEGTAYFEREVRQLCADFPRDLMMCCWSEDKNTIVADDLMRPAEPWRYESLQKEQEGKDFYFPKTSEVEDFYRNGYPAGQAEFRELGRIMMEWGGVRRTGGNGNPG